MMLKTITLSVFAVVGFLLQVEGKNCDKVSCSPLEYCCVMEDSPVMTLKCSPVAIPGKTCRRIPLPRVTQPPRPATTTSPPTTTTKSTTTIKPTTTMKQTTTSNHTAILQHTATNHPRTTTTPTTASVTSTAVSSTTADPAVCGSQRCESGQYCCFESFTTVSSCMNSIPSKSTYLCKRVQTFLPTTTTPKTTNVPAQSDASVKVQITSTTKVPSPSSAPAVKSHSSPSVKVHITSTTKVPTPSSSPAVKSHSSPSVKVHITSGISCGSSTCSIHQYCCKKDWDGSGKSCFDTQPSLITHSCDNAFPSFVHTAWSFSIAAIVGIVVGSILFIVLVSASVFCAVRRLRKPTGHDQLLLIENASDVDV